MPKDLELLARRAPGLQPDDTGVATLGDHAGGMKKRTAEEQREGVAIERHECDGRKNEDAS
jgi:hypothetical protein